MSKRKSMERLKKVWIFVLLIISLSACKFFGKKTEQPSPLVQGRFSDGTSILGTWSASVLEPTRTHDPSYAYTSMYHFDPIGGVRIEIADGKSSGIVCTAFGQYRVVGSNEVVIVVQATNPSLCAFQPQFRLSEVKVHTKSLHFKDPVSNENFVYFTARPQAGAPVGVWDFASAGAVNGEGGLDLIFLDSQGYFLIQTTLDGKQILFIGYVDIQSGSLKLTFFEGMDPSRPIGKPWVFSQFITDGQVLQLVEDSAEGQVVYTGRKK